MIKKPHRRFLLLMVMLLMVVTLNTGPAPQVAECAPSAAKARCVSLPIYTYYTDATKTVACGYFEVCSGAEVGCHTEYKTSVRKPCCNPL